jgi:hypothetical protein
MLIGQPKKRGDKQFLKQNDIIACLEPGQSTPHPHTVYLRDKFSFYDSPTPR